MSEKKVIANGGEDVVIISIEGTSEPNTRKELNGLSSESIETKSQMLGQLMNVESPSNSCPSPEIARNTPGSEIQPNSKTLVRKRTLNRSVYSKPKSRFGEQPSPADLDILDENMKLREDIDPRSGSNMPSISPKEPVIASTQRVDEDEEIYRKVNQVTKKRSKKVKAKALVEWIALLCLLGCLIASLTIHEVKNYRIWGLQPGKWFGLVLVIFCGMFVTRWFMYLVVFLIEMNFLMRKKVLYFIHALKKSVEVLIWLALVLLTWIFLFEREAEQSKTAVKVLNYITWTIVTLLIGAFLWVLKTLLLKILASSFHVNTFFDRIQESIFHQYVLQCLSGPPIMKGAENILSKSTAGKLHVRNIEKGKEGKRKETIDVAKIHELKRDKISAWTMKVLVDVIGTTGLSTISSTLDDDFKDEAGKTDKEITSEMEAIAAAYHIFRNVAPAGRDYIEEEDLMGFMIKEEVDLVLPLIGVAETGRIDRKALTDWVVKVYQGRKALAHALNDTKTAVEELNKLVIGILIIVLIIIWLLLMGIATTKVLVLLSSQLVVAAFIFGNTCKTIFEAIIFVFVMHPFDVGDRCVIDGVQMVVEEMNILTTVFLRYDNQKIYYPNSVLSTKPIGNFYRSPDMGDSVEFSVDFKTPVEKIGSMKDKIKRYLEENPQHWHPNHSVVVKEIENVNKIKMVLFINHTMNFQEYPVKNKRRSEVVLELKRIFEDLAIKYDLLPQEVLLRNDG